VDLSALFIRFGLPSSISSQAVSLLMFFAVSFLRLF
jgi:hypothetical protein